MSFSFEKAYAMRRHHIYKNASSGEAKIGDKFATELETKKEYLDIDPYFCAVKIKNKYFKQLLTICLILRKIYRHVHFFIKTESRSVHLYIESLGYRASPILVCEHEIPFRLTFSCPKEQTMTLMKDFFIILYTWTFTREMEEDNNSDGYYNENRRREIKK